MRATPPRLVPRQSGQSLVEALVVAAAMLSAFLAVPLIAKYQDIRHAAIAASRTAAFECSVRPDACGDPTAPQAVAADLRRRHFGRHDHDLLTADAMADGAPVGERNRFWVDRRGSSLLARQSDVEVQFGLGSSDAMRGAWDKAGGEGGRGVGAGAMANAMSASAGPAAFGLDVSGGLVTAQVRARVSLDRTLAQWLQKPEGMSLALSGRTAVMTDAWNASSGKQAEDRSIQSRVDRGRRLPGFGGTNFSAGSGESSPAGAAGPAGGTGPEDALDLLYTPIRELITGPLLAPLEPRGRLFRYHDADVEIVPADRLGQP